MIAELNLVISLPFTPTIYVAFGICAMLLILSIDTIHRWMVMKQQYLESVMLKRLAYVDGMTGLGNRSAYDKKMDWIFQGDEKCRSMSILMLDD